MNCFLRLLRYNNNYYKKSLGGFLFLLSKTLLYFLQYANRILYNFSLYTVSFLQSFLEIIISLPSASLTIIENSIF